MFGWFSDAKHLRLALESGHAVVILREGLGQNLDGDVAPADSPLY